MPRSSQRQHDLMQVPDFLRQDARTIGLILRHTQYEAEARKALERFMENYQGNQRHAAKALGISRTTLRGVLETYKIL